MRGNLKESWSLPPESQCLIWWWWAGFGVFNEFDLILSESSLPLTINDQWCQIAQKSWGNRFHSSAITKHPVIPQSWCRTVILHVTAPRHYVQKFRHFSHCTAAEICFRKNKFKEWTHRMVENLSMICKGPKIVSNRWKSDQKPNEYLMTVAVI